MKQDRTALALLIGLPLLFGAPAPAQEWADPVRMMETVRHFATFPDGSPRSRFCFRVEMDAAEADLLDRLESALARRGSASLWPFAPEEPPDKWDSTGVVPYRKTFYNVVGLLPGSRPGSGKFLITSHFDAIGTRTTGWQPWSDVAPGADDNLSGTAAVLELARLLAGDPPYPFDIQFVCFDGEELGLWGSQAFAEAESTAGADILGVLNMDMIAYNPRQDSLVAMTNYSSLYLADFLVVSEELDPQPDFAVARSINNIFFSDHGPFWERDYPAILLIEETRIVRHNPFYHMVTDVDESISRQGDQMAKGTNTILKALRRLGEGADGPPDYRISDADMILSVNHVIESITATPGDSIRINVGFFNVGGASAGGPGPRASFHRIVDGERRLLFTASLDDPVVTGRHIQVPIDMVVGPGDVGAITVEAEIGDQVARRSIPVRADVARLVRHYMAPNPVRDPGRAVLAYELSRESTVRLTLIDFHGHEVGKDVFRYSRIPSDPGRHVATGLNRVPLTDLLDGLDPAPGVYFYRIELFPENAAEAQSTTGKFAILR